MERIKAILHEATALMDFSPINALMRMARFCNSFEEFKKHYLININHGYFWHFTKSSHFQRLTTVEPRDMSSMADGTEGDDKGAMMVTSDFEYWDEYYNEDASKIARPYVALVDLSFISPSNIKQVSRGFGNEIYLSPDVASDAVIVGTFPVAIGRRMDGEFEKMIPQSKTELKSLYNNAHHQETHS